MRSARARTLSLGQRWRNRTNIGHSSVNPAGMHEGAQSSNPTPHGHDNGISVPEIPLEEDTIGVSHDEDHGHDDDDHNHAGPPAPAPDTPIPDEQPIRVDPIVPDDTRDLRDIQHFFELMTWCDVKGTSVCKLCRSKYETDERSFHIINFAYGPNAHTSTLRAHIGRMHIREWIIAAKESDWAMSRTIWEAMIVQAIV